MKVPKIEYKQGVFPIKTDNIWGIKDWDQAEKHFYFTIEGLKLLKDPETRCGALNFYLGCGFGLIMTKEYFSKVLDYLDLDYETFEAWIEDMNKDTPMFDLNMFKWFKDLDNPFYRPQE